MLNQSDPYPDDDEWNIYAPNETKTGINRYCPKELPFYATNTVGTQTIVFGSLFTPTLDLQNSGQNSVSVTVGGVSNASGYQLQYSTDSSFSTGVTTLNVQAGTRTVTGLRAGTKYYFRVKAVGSGNNSDSVYSAVKSITTSSSVTKLSTPSLSLTVTGSNSISATIGSVSNASGYKLQYSTDSSFSSGVTTLNVSAGTRSISNLSASTTYYFRVQALGSGNYSNSDYSATKSATTNAAPLTLAVPTISVTPVNYYTINVLVGSVEHATGYTLQYATDPYFTDASTWGVSAGTNVFEHLSPNTTYYFRVRAIGSGDYLSSNYSAAKSATTFANTSIDYVGDTLSAAKTISFSSNTYTFTDKLGEGTYGLKDVDIYKLVVSSSDIGRTYTFTTSQPSGGADGDTYIRLFNSSGSELAYNDDVGTGYYSRLSWTPAAAGTYYLGVSSYYNRNYVPTTAGSAASNGRQGDYTLTVSRSAIQSKLDAPTLTINSNSTNSISVTVGSVANASGYTLEYSTSESFTGAKTQSAYAGSNTLTNLSSNTTYYIRVKALGSGNYTDSNYSAVKTAKTYATKLSAPTLNVSAAGSNSVYVTVGTVPSAAGYRLQYSTSSSFTNPETLTVQAGSNSVKNLTANVTYYFRVMAIGSVDYGDSDYNSAKSVVVTSDYIASDVDSLRQFLERTDSSGVRNGTKINSAYNADNIATWSGVTWKEVNGVQRVTTIDWYNKQLVGSLDLSGYTELKRLLCYNNQLTSLNVSGCTSMTWLRCDNNLLTSLNVSGCSKLSELQCDSNPLTSLDVRNCAALESLNCWGPNLETVAFNSSAQSLTFNFDNSWTFKDGKGRSLGVSYSYEYKAGNSVTLPITATNNGQTIRFITASNESLAVPTLSVSVTGSNSVSVTVGRVANASEYRVEYSTSSNFTNPNIRNVSAGTSSIGNLAANTTYYFRVQAIGSGIYSDSNYSATVSAKTNAVITASDVSCLLEFLEETDSRGVKNGTKINSDYDRDDTSTWTGVTWSKINGVDRVTMIDWRGKQLSGTLNLSGCTALTSLNLAYRYDSGDYYYNDLSSLNVSGCTALKYLNCDCNNLTSLDVSKNTALTTLICSNNQLTSLDVSKNILLTSLSCYCNRLTSLDVSKNTALQLLNCFTNKLTSLDVTKNTALTRLDVYYNQLTSLDVTKNTALTYLSCARNRLTSLDVSKNTALTYVNCWTSDLVSVTLPKTAVSNGLSVSMYGYNASWTYKNAAGTVLQSDVSSDTDFTVTTIPFTAVNQSTGQVISFDEKRVVDNVGDSFSTAKTITFTNNTFTFTDKLGEGEYDLKDVDIYKLVISSSDIGKSYTFTTSMPSGGKRVDPYIRLFDSSGSQIASKYNGSYSSLTWGPPSPGTYYVGVSTYGNRVYNPTTAGSASANGTQGDYTLTVTRNNGAEVSINGKKVTVSWVDNNHVADSVRYREAGTTKWTTKNLKSGVTTFTFNAKVGTTYEIQVLLDQKVTNVLHSSAVVLDQAKLKADKATIKDDTFQVNVTNYAAKNLAANAKQAILTVNGVQTVVGITNQQGTAALNNGGNVAFSNGLFTFSGMASNTAYKIQVAFSDGLSVSTVSSNLSVKTLKAPYLAPVLKSATATSYTTILVNWESSVGKGTSTAAQYYTVQYSLDGKKWINATTKATGNSFLIQKLKLNTTYFIAVIATKDQKFNASEQSNLLTVTTVL